MKVSLEIEVLFDQRGQLGEFEAAVGGSLERIERAFNATSLSSERQLDASFSRFAGRVGDIETTFQDAFGAAELAVEGFGIGMERSAESWAESVADFSSSASDSLRGAFIEPAESRFKDLDGVVASFGENLLEVVTHAVSQSSSQLSSLQELIGSLFGACGVDVGSVLGGGIVLRGELLEGLAAGSTWEDALTSLLGGRSVTARKSKGTGVGSAVGALVGSFTPLTPIGGGLLGGAIGNVLSNLGRGPREDDPDITILEAAERLAFAFPADRAASIAALTDLLDDMFQLRDYVSPTAYAAILDATGPVGNIRSTLERRPGFDAPIAAVVEQALGHLARAVEGVRTLGAEGASRADISETSRIAKALDLVVRDLSGSIRSGELPRFAGGGISPGGWVVTEPSELILNRQQQLNLLSQLDRPAQATAAPAAAGVVNYYEIRNEFNVRELRPADFERYLRSVRFKNFMTSLGPNRRDVLDARNVRSFERSVYQVVSRAVK